jgi:hypothetical protein
MVASVDADVAAAAAAAAVADRSWPGVKHFCLDYSYQQGPGPAVSASVGTLC